MKSKKILIYIISMIILFAVATVGYKFLSERYTNETLENLTNEKIPENKLLVKNMAKDFTVYNIDGDSVKLSDYKGKKPVVINFWASWCPPCKEEMPFFQEATNAYSSDDIEILMINLTDGMRETKETALNYMKENNYSMNVMFDIEFSAAEAYRINSIPRTMFVDKDGYISGEYSGMINKNVLNDNIEKLIQ